MERESYRLECLRLAEQHADQNRTSEQIVTDAKVFSDYVKGDDEKDGGE